MQEGTQISNKLNHNTISGMFFNTVGSIFYLLTQWLLNIIVVRILGYADSGLISLAISFTSIFGNVALFGMRNFQSSDINNEFSNNTYIKSRIITCFMSIILCFVSVVFIGYNIRQSQAILAFMLLRTVESFVDVFHGINQKKWQLKINGLSFIIRGALQLFVFIFIIVTTRNIVTAILMMAIMGLLVVIVFDYLQTKKIDNIDNLQPANKILVLLKECLPLAIFLILSSLIMFIPKFFIERILDSEKLGIYASITTPTLLVQAVITITFGPMVTQLAILHKNKDTHNFFVLVVKTLVLVIIISVFGGIVVILLGDWGLKLLYGESILPYSYLLISSYITIILTTLSQLLGSIITVLRKQNILLLISLISTIICGCISVPFIKSYYLQGANYTLIIALLVQLILSIIIVFKNFRRGEI